MLSGGARSRVPSRYTSPNRKRLQQGHQQHRRCALPRCCREFIGQIPEVRVRPPKGPTLTLRKQCTSKGGSYAIRYTAVYVRVVSGSRWMSTRTAGGARSGRAERRTGAARSAGARRGQGRTRTRGPRGAGGTCWATRSSVFQFLCGSREWRNCVQSGRGSSGCYLRKCSG
jgi:hypothetical protein